MGLMRAVPPPSLKARMDAVVAGLQQASAELLPHADLVTDCSSATSNLVSDLYNLSTLLVETSSPDDGGTANEVLRMGVAKAIEDGNIVVEGLSHVSDGLSKLSGLHDDALAAGVGASLAVGAGAGAAPLPSVVQR
jgi:hypothetical protein